MAAGKGDNKHTAHQEQLPFIKRYRTEVSASASSVLSTLTAFPLDSVKTRMQTYNYSGFLGCVKHTYQTEQLRGFFRGEHFLLHRFSKLVPRLLAISNARVSICRRDCPYG